MKRSSKYACKRCARHKKKCQPAEGPCLNCTRVGTECSRVRDGVRRTSNGSPLVELLQQTIRLLEDEITQLQTRVLPVASPPSGLEANPEPLMVPEHSPAILRSEEPGGKNQDEQRYSVGLETAIQIWRSMLPSVESGTKHFVYLDRLFSGAELPFPLTLRFKGGNPTPPILRDTSKATPVLPRNISERLLQVYIDRILPQCPIFSPTEMHTIYDRLYGEPAQSENAVKGDLWIISMTMAVATLTSKSDAYRKVAELAEALRMEAMHSDPEREMLATTSIRCLQGLLLLTQYGLLMPQAVDLWHTVSEAMRVAVELGLHREPPEAMNLCQEAIQARHRLFWATYSMERAVTLTCHRPFPIRDDQIKLNTVPTAELNTPTLTWGTSPEAAARYLTHLAYCLLQTEITSINISSEPIQPPSLSYIEWVGSCERRIEALRGGDWHEAILIPDWLDLPAWRCLAWLYMPCPRNPCPSDETITKFVQALMHILETYWLLARKKSLKLCWSAVHHAYEVGAQMLFCMQNYPHIVQASYDKITLFDALTHLSDFFIVMEERWPAASQCKLLLEKLRKGIIEAFLQGESSTTLSETQSDEQRIVDIIFRKNGYFFFAEEEAFDMQAYLIESFTNPNLSLTFDVSSTTSTLLDPFDLYNQAFIDSGYSNENILDWSSSGVVWDTEMIDMAAVFPATSTAEAESTKLSADTQELVDKSTRNLERISVCKYCRSKRIKCSRTLPSCHNCVDYEQSCLYMESSTGDWVSGKYLDELQKKLSDLLRVHQAQSIPRKPSTSSMQQAHGPGSLRKQSNVLLLAYETCYGPSTCYWGESSVLGKLVSASLPVVKPLGYRHFTMPASIPHWSAEPILRSLHQLPEDFLFKLIGRYCRKIETFLPILGRESVSELVKSVDKRDVPDMVNDLRSCALLHIVVAIALALPFGERSASISMSICYFNRGMSLASSTPSLFLTSTIESLQFALLICIYVQLHPLAGNLSRLVNAACRICLDLFESQDLSTEETTTLHVLFRTTYILDTDTAVAFGRPNYLPEWKSQRKMVVPTGTRQDNGTIAVLAYNSARLRSTIHNAAISVVDKPPDGNLFFPSTTTALRAELGNWWDEWQREVSTFSPTTESPNDRPGPCPDGILHYGSFAYFQAVTLLRLLAKIRGDDEESVLTLSCAESIVVTHSELQNIDSAKQIATVSDYEFPVFWNHYHDIFGAGLEFLAPYASETMDSSKRGELLECCHRLLRLFEHCIGTREWLLSARLSVLMRETSRD